MDWDIAENMRVDIVAYEKHNHSGQQHFVQIFPSGRQGDLPDHIGSVLIAGPLGTRVIFQTTLLDDWQAAPWRCVQLVAGHAFKAKNGFPCVRVPDLDFLDAFNAQRTDPDFEQSFPIVKSLAEGTGWTFGRPGAIKDHVVRIRIERAS